MTIKNGTPTGLCDSDGKMIKVGDLVRTPSTINKNIHGAHITYRIRLQGIIPVVSYVESEPGQVLPIDYTAGFLSDKYDQKMLVFANDPSKLRPDEHMIVIGTFDERKLGDK